MGCERVSENFDTFLSFHLQLQSTTIDHRETSPQISFHSPPISSPPPLPPVIPPKKQKYAALITRQGAMSLEDVKLRSQYSLIVQM